MKNLTIVGARPQFVKAAAVCRAVGAWNADHPDRRIEDVIVHTGQHFDFNMSQSFFDELAIPDPKHNLGIHGGGHGQMTGRMLEQLEAVMQEERPDQVLVYGDTNSTLAGALAAAKLHIPVCHVEAGLRSFNRLMPEEINRVVADSLATLLLCPTEVAVTNLGREGIESGVHHVGDVMYDVALHFGEAARRKSAVLHALGLKDRTFVLATCHRAENTDDQRRLKGIAQGLAAVSERIPVVLPLHPRTRAALGTTGIRLPETVKVCDPLPFLDMLRLEMEAALIVTDSGGVQKEAYFYGKPCVTMREETEWVETVETGWNRLAGADHARIVAAVDAFLATDMPPRAPIFGDGRAADRIVDVWISAAA
jgi:UDP-GlcNAc3NAcA epimerase